MMNGLWGEEFEINDQTDQILEKIKSSSSSTEHVKTINKQLKSNKLTLKERLEIIKRNVYTILGKQKDNIIILKNKETLNNYINKCIENGIMALDTETNNTLDYINCKLMGPCLYTPGLQQAYVPINHIDPETNERLIWQLTEQDIREALQKLINNNVKIIFHNYKFDYQVLKTTCHIEVPAYWDTMIGIKMINENYKASLKKLYITKIDPTQAMYDIEDLFDAKFVQYAQVNPELFALYAATDSMMTYKLYLYEKDILETEEYKGMYNIFMTIEMPIISIVADMEYRGIGINQEYAQRLSEKYHKQQEQLNKNIEDELKIILPKINAWRLTPEAQIKEGKKTKNEILENPINFDSPKQLAILLFDILKFPEGLGKTVYDTPRGTGSNILELLAKDYEFKLGSLLAEKKGLDKLVNTFIDALPQQVNYKDGKIHCAFNQLGAIARFSSANPNLQNIPSSDKSIRPMFNVNADCRIIKEDEDYEYLNMSTLDNDNSLTINNDDEIYTNRGYLRADQVQLSDIIINGDSKITIKQILPLNREICFILGNN